jgi:hypothetical protein
MVKKQFKEEVAKAVDKYKYQSPYLNALIMWSHNPISPSAGYGFEDNIPFIEKNISLMFQDENTETVTNATYLDIVNLGGTYEQLHDDQRDPYYVAYDEILKQIYTKYASKIFSNIHEAIEQAKDFRILELANSFKEFLIKEDHLDYRPTNTEKIIEGLDVSLNKSDIKEIESTFKKRTNYNSPSLDFLVSIGLLYEMYYKSASGKVKGAKYLVPLHVPEALSNYDIPHVKMTKEIGTRLSSTVIPVHEDDAVMLHDAGVQSTIIWKGKIRKATNALAALFEDMGEPICIIDNHLDYRTFEIIKEVILTFELNPKINVRVLTENIRYPDDTLRAFENVIFYIPNLQVRWIEKKFENPFHDRYVLTKIAGIQIGTSIKDLGGRRLSVISKLDSNDKNSLLEIFHRVWNDIAIDFP